MTPSAHNRANRMGGKAYNTLLGLVGIAALSIVAISLVEQRTHDRIIANAADRSLKAVQAVLPAGEYDNDPNQDQVWVSDVEYLGAAKPVPVYRARAGDRVIAVAIPSVTADGYVGPIRVLTGIDKDGRIVAVRVIAHRETPGLGDAIEIKRSGWIENFNGRSLQESKGGMALQKDGGDIDHITGATITSRAVTNAVGNALRYYELNQRTLTDNATAN